MRTRAVTAALALAMSLASTPAKADVIHFDDVSTNVCCDYIPNGYHGLNWANFGVLDAALYSAGQSGYSNGLISPRYVAFNEWGAPAFMSDGQFTFNSAYFTAAWNDGLEVTVQGLLGLTVLHTVTFTLDTSGPVLKTFNWSGIDSVQFSSTGGTLHAGYTGYGTHFAMDDLTINAVPEPTGITLFAAFVAGVWLAARKRRA